MEGTGRAYREWCGHAAHLTWSHQVADDDDDGVPDLGERYTRELQLLVAGEGGGGMPMDAPEHS